MSKEKLKPCSECSEVPFVLNSLKGHRIICGYCGRKTNFYKSKSEAIKAWNRRTV